MTFRSSLPAMLCAGAVTAQFVGGKATRDALFWRLWTRRLADHSDRGVAVLARPRRSQTRWGATMSPTGCFSSRQPRRAFCFWQNGSSASMRRRCPPSSFTCTPRQWRPCSSPASGDVLNTLRPSADRGSAPFRHLAVLVLLGTASAAYSIICSRRKRSKRSGMAIRSCVSSPFIMRQLAPLRSFFR